ncbi:hypothetical protein IEZ26_13165 [Nocardioides cavernae]|uniref:Lipoprotein n=1 Tax=Nocardioides cavernae TaxID=1921566 RepID=A0ABR8NGK4_9ACTN|nr:hypothetical protein [Nocardioides cavernae]MBD3925579.1 hypothetical protein [Nocardioides cavernae]MBM7514041.1 hypothetical protein [Nocardioides cavernae]
MLLAASLLTGCGGGSECEVAAHVVSEVSPSLVLASVTGTDGGPIDSVELSRLRFDGHRVDRRSLVSSWLSEGLSLDRGRLVCSLPCGLAGATGRWQIRVTGPAGSTALVDVQGHPRLSPGGCSPVVGRVPTITPELTPGADAS